MRRFLSISVGFYTIICIKAGFVKFGWCLHNNVSSFIHKIIIQEFHNVKLTISFVISCSRLFMEEMFNVLSMF